ncbi:MAG: hypothetical protein ABR555_03265 [Pyrinomonadaceae bacterium]
MKRIPQQQRNARIRRARDTNALSRLGLLMFCGLVLASGFILAGKQHFAAVEYGYASENLRREHQRLTEEKQRLILEKERVSAPARLAPAARQLGLHPATAGQIATAEPGNNVETADTRGHDQPTRASVR